MQVTLKRNEYDKFMDSLTWFTRLQIGCYEHSVYLFIRAKIGDISFDLTSITDTKTTITIQVMAKKKTKKKEENKIITTFDTEQPQILPLDECYFTGKEAVPAFKTVGTADSGSQYDGTKINKFHSDEMGKVADVTSFLPPSPSRTEYKGASAADLILRMDRVLVLPDPADALSQGGIFIPEELRPKSVRGTVISIGPGLLNGEEMETKPGDIVVYPRYMGTEIVLNNKEYLLIPENDISAIEEKPVGKIS